MSDDAPVRAGINDVHPAVIEALRRQALHYIKVQNQCKDVIQRNRDEIEITNRQLLEAEQAQRGIEAAIEKLRTAP